MKSTGLLIALLITAIATAFMLKTFYGSKPLSPELSVKNQVDNMVNEVETLKNKSIQENNLLKDSFQDY